MSALTGRLPHPAWIVGGIAFGALLGVAALRSGPGVVLALVAGLVGAASCVYLLWHVHPAWTLTAALVATIFSDNWRHLGIPPLDRALVVVGILAVVLRAPAIRDRAPLRLEPVHWLLAVISVYAIGSAVIAGTLTTGSGPFRLLDRLPLLGFALFFLAPVVFREQRYRNVFLWSLVGLGAYLSLTSLFETIGFNQLVFPKYILDPNLGSHPGRARGPFVEAVANGAAMYACAAAAAIAFVTSRTPLRRGIALGVLLLCALGCMFTLQRSVWIASAVGTLGALVVFRELRRYLIPVVAGLVLMITGALLLIPGLGEKARQRAQSHESIWDRRNLNAAAVRMVDAKPLLGFGWDRFGADSHPYFFQQKDIPITTAATISIVHSTVLSNAVELGLLGTALWAIGVALAIGGAIVRRGPPELKPWRIALFAIALAWLINSNSAPLPQPFPNFVLWAWAGLVMADVRRDKGKGASVDYGVPVTTG